MSRRLLAAAVLALAMGGLAACTSPAMIAEPTNVASAATEGSPPPTDGSITPTPQPTFSQPAAVPGFPDELQGRWCTRVVTSGIPECVELAEIARAYPEVFLVSSSVYEGATTYEICVEPSTGPGECAGMAATTYLTYYPVGVGRPCDHSVMFTKCDPDYSDAHDTSQPRLVQEFNHQMDDVYHDSPPMYRV